MPIHRYTTIYPPKGTSEQQRTELWKSVNRAAKGTVGSESEETPSGVQSIHHNIAATPETPAAPEDRTIPVPGYSEPA